MYSLHNFFFVCFLRFYLGVSFNKNITPSFPMFFFCDFQCYCISHLLCLVCGLSQSITKNMSPDYALSFHKKKIGFPSKAAV